MQPVLQKAIDGSAAATGVLAVRPLQAARLFAAIAPDGGPKQNTAASENDAALMRNLRVLHFAKVGQRARIARGRLRRGRVRAYRDVVLADMRIRRTRMDAPVAGETGQHEMPHLQLLEKVFQGSFVKRRVPRFDEKIIVLARLKRTYDLGHRGPRLQGVAHQFIPIRSPQAEVVVAIDDRHRFASRALAQMGNHGAGTGGVAEQSVAAFEIEIANDIDQK